MQPRRPIRSLRCSLSAGISLSCFLACFLAFALSTLAQEALPRQVGTRAGEEEASKGRRSDTLEDQRRAFAISLISSLGTEARGYSDLTLRPRVLARAADVIWDSDQSAAQSLFRRAWEAAEKGDAEDATVKPKDDTPSMVSALRRLGGRDLRAEVLSLVARRDRVLAEEFLAKLKSASDRESSQAKTSSRSSDGWSMPDAMSKRILAAGQLLKEGQIERAIEFATPALNQVTAGSIGFLTNLRAQNPQIADQRFAMLMAQAELDPLSDANTVSGLSSYVVSPGLYLTYAPDGSAVWSQPENPPTPPNLSPALRNQFYRVAGSILLRPLPAPDQDFTSSGRRGKYLVIKNLLPYFDQYAPDTAVALHAQLTALGGDSASNNDRFAPRDSKPAPSNNDVFERMQYDLDHARTSSERDEICAAAALKLTGKGDARARDVVDKIDDAQRRAKVREFVDFEFIRLALRNKEPQEAARLARIGQVNHAQRAWAYVQSARLLTESKRENILELLDEAMAEIQRIEDSPRNRAILLIGVVNRMLAVDNPRAWQVMYDAVKAANQADNFTGENQITFSIGALREIKFTQIGAEESGLAGVFRLLAKDDLNRSVEMARSLKSDAPRANAIIAIAGLLLDKQETRSSNNQATLR